MPELPCDVDRVRDLSATVASAKTAGKVSYATKSPAVLALATVRRATNPRATNVDESSSPNSANLPISSREQSWRVKRSGHPRSTDVAKLAILSSGCTARMNHVGGRELPALFRRTSATLDRARHWTERGTQPWLAQKRLGKCHTPPSPQPFWR